MEVLPPDDQTVDVSARRQLVVDLTEPASNHTTAVFENNSDRRFNNCDPSSPTVAVVVPENVTRNSIGGYDFTNHCHPQISPARDRTAEKTLMAVCVLTVFFIIGEVVGGYFAGSLAIMTDAAHMLSDLASFLISLFAIWVARRPATRTMSFGFYRAEVMGAVCSILIIWVLTGILVYMAVLRVIHEDYSINSTVMLATSACGVAFNIIMGAVLHKGGHGHSHGGGGHGHSHRGGHGHSHGRPRGEENPNYEGSAPQHNNHLTVPSISAGSAENGLSSRGSFSRKMRSVSVSAYPTEETWHTKRQKNINVRAAFVHVVGDLVQSIGVLIAALIIHFKPEYKVADPICTFLFSVLVLITTVTVMRDAVHVLMEGTPRDVNYLEVLGDLETVEGVEAAHSLHMWSLTMDKAALAVHLAIDKRADPLAVMHKASRMMRFKYNLTFTTIQVEPFDPSVMTSCLHCIGPAK